MTKRQLCGLEKGQEITVPGEEISTIKSWGLLTKFHFTLTESKRQHLS
jgi:hypothetical protein